MKWSKLSIGRQIGLIAVVLSALLVAIVVINAVLVIGQSQAAWRESAELIHQEAANVLSENLARVELVAAGASAEPAIVSESPDEATLEARQRLLDLLIGLCPAILSIETESAHAETRAVDENGFSDLINLPELSGSPLYGILYSYWVKGGSSRVQVYVSAQALSKQLPQRPNARIMLLDGKNQVAACNDTAKIGTHFSPSEGEIFTDNHGRTYIQHISEAPQSRYRVVTLVSGAAELEQRVGRIIPVNIFATLLMVGIAAACFYLLHLSVSKPIGDMMDTLSILRKRPDARLSMTLRGNREMMELSRSFNKMMDENERLNVKLVEANVRLYQAELVRKQTDMAMLVSQINPHFLYNTLEVIKGMAYSVGAKTIVEMTRALGTIFRYSLKAPEVVTLRQETDMLKNYLTIQLARFGDRFQVHYDLPEELMDEDVLKMVLQPLCENAITHGLEMMEKGGHLSISAFQNEGSLFLTVQDNGLGMDEETLRQVRTKLEKISDVSSLYEMGSDGIGLVNVHGRIRMRFGEGYGLSIDSQAGKGTRVVLRMPGRRPQDCIKY